MSSKLRTAVSRELTENASKYCQSNPHIKHVAASKSLLDDDILILFQIMITNDDDATQLSADTLERAVRTEGEMNKIDNRYCGMLQFMALSTLLKKSIVSIYPNCSFAYRELFHATILPLQHDTRHILVPPTVNRPLIFLWTRSGGHNETNDFFTANHVVPIIKSSKRSESPESDDSESFYTINTDRKTNPVYTSKQSQSSTNSTDLSQMNEQKNQYCPITVPSPDHPITGLSPVKGSKLPIVKEEMHEEGSYSSPNAPSENIVHQAQTMVS